MCIFYDLHKHIEWSRHIFTAAAGCVSGPRSPARSARTPATMPPVPTPTTPICLLAPLVDVLVIPPAVVGPLA